MRLLPYVLVLAAASVASAQSTTAPTPPYEPHLADVRQLTLGGENAEAYWAWSGNS